MPASSQLPIVAIVGRPNVGKSTLFNRFAGRRRALVEDHPGVTRDRIAEEVEVDDRRILLVDTAGLEPREHEGLPGAVQALARSALDDADAIIFVVDGKSGLLPEDEVIAKILHRSAKPVLVAVNKIDVPKHEERSVEFQSLGFEHTWGVSAEHGRGAWDALEMLVATFPDQGPEEAAEAGIRIAMVGRPNVGKSSLVNRLVGAERVVVSDVPGTTRDTIDIRVEIEGDVFTLVDTAGLRRPGRRDRTVEKPSALMTVRSLERAEVALLVFDAEEGFTDQDARVARLARDRGCATLVLANKWDLVGRDHPDDPDAANAIRETAAHGLRFMSDAPMLTVSAKTGSGIQKIFPMVRRIAEAGRTKIPTAALNRWLKDVVQRHEPAMAQRGGFRRQRLKFFYATQLRVSPPTFLLFCTDPAAVQPSYKRFLENRLRETFDLEGTPVRLQLLARGGRDA
jgi:GTP-binding protein